MELLRSLIFVPGNRPNMLERAKNFKADIVMVDLEDSVPPSEKIVARELASEWVATLTDNNQKVMIRVNSLDTGLTKDELTRIVSPQLYGISLGKVTSRWDIQSTDRMLIELEERLRIPVGTIKIIPWIETAKAIMELNAISSASKRIIAIAFGAEDYTNDMGILRTDMGPEVEFPRSAVAIAARAANIAALDSPFVSFKDPVSLKADSMKACQLGYTGKFAIHPDQLEIINQTFSPSKEDIEYALRVVEGWNEALKIGRGSFDLDGKMVDVPVVKRAQNLLSLSHFIALKEQ
ncbi:MAG: CoA ester lyase [Chloroflexota bacterium]|nr:CoA ester lyase [Chloroflexota bacterium]